MGVDITVTEAEVENPANNRQRAELNNSQNKLVPVAKTNFPLSWKIEDSEALYRIEGWGQPYFSINALGHVTVSPKVIAGFFGSI
jgi:arginine decarboxylase